MEKERATQREHRRSAEGPPQCSSEYQLVLECEESTPGPEENHLRGLEVTVLKSHIGLRIVPVTTSQAGKTHNSQDKGRLPRRFCFSSGEISPETNCSSDLLAKLAFGEQERLNDWVKAQRNFWYAP